MVNTGVVDVAFAIHLLVNAVDFFVEVVVLLPDVLDHLVLLLDHHTEVVGSVEADVLSELLP